MVVPAAKQTNGEHQSNIEWDCYKVEWNDTFLTHLHDDGNPTTKMTLGTPTPF